MLDDLARDGARHRRRAHLGPQWRGRRVLLWGLLSDVRAAAICRGLALVLLSSAIALSSGKRRKFDGSRGLLSGYFQSMQDTAFKKRYRRKLGYGGGVDPYELPLNEWEDVKLWPSITYIHVGMYLLCSSSSYRNLPKTSKETYAVTSVHVSISFQVMYLADVGGTSLEQVIRRIMGTVISNTLSRKFNVFGRFNKEAFAHTRLMEVVYSKWLNSYATTWSVSDAVQIKNKTMTDFNICETVHITN